MGEASPILINFVKNKGEIMKCLACGREMLNRGTHFDCPNILCDYEEDIENTELRVPVPLLRQEIPIMAKAVK